MYLVPARPSCPSISAMKAVVTSVIPAQLTATIRHVHKIDKRHSINIHEIEGPTVWLAANYLWLAVASRLRLFRS